MVFTSSDRYEDELIWSAAWLYKATGELEYLTKAEEMYASRQQTWVSWSFDWADKLPGAQLLLYELTGKSKLVLPGRELFQKIFSLRYKDDIEQFCDAALAVQKSPGGQTFRAQWGSNRYASNFAFICLGVSSAPFIKVNLFFCNRQPMLGSRQQSTEHMPAVRLDTCWATTQADSATSLAMGTTSQSNPTTRL